LARQPLPGVIVVPKELPIGVTIEELVTLQYFSFPKEFPGRIIHLSR
jgi:hypothetical protein